MSDQQALHSKQAQPVHKEETEDIWTSAFDSKTGTAASDPPPLQLKAAPPAEGGDDTTHRVLLSLGIDPDSTGLPEAEQQLLASMLAELSTSGQTRQGADGEMIISLRREDAMLKLTIVPATDGGQPTATINFTHGKYALSRSVTHEATAAPDQDSDQDVQQDAAPIQIVGAADDGYFEGKGGISISEEYLEEFKSSKAIGQEGGTGQADPHLGYRRNVQVSLEDGRKVYLQVEGYVRKGITSVSPSHATYRLLVTRQDGNQGFAQGSYVDPTGQLDIDELLAQLATQSSIPAPLLQRGQPGEPFIDAAIAQASTMLQPIPQAQRGQQLEGAQGEQSTESAKPLKDWASMTEAERREEATEYFKKEFSWPTVIENLGIALAAIVALYAIPSGAIAGVVLAGIFIQMAIAYGIYTIIAPYFEGEAPGWMEWIKGGLLIIGGVAGGAALGLASPELAALAGTVAIVAGIAYALIEAFSAYTQFEEGVASDTREGMQEQVKSSAREAEHALPDAIVAALAAKDLKQLLSRIRPLTPEAPAPSPEASPLPEPESTTTPAPEEAATTTSETEPTAADHEPAPGELQGGTAKGKNRFGLPSIEPVSIEFRPGAGIDQAEFARQMQSQEDGLNRMTVEEWLRNRDSYLQNNRAKEGDKAQKSFREKELQKKIDELVDQNPDLTDTEAESLAKQWISDKAALHDPDQVAGGNPLHITGLGDRKVNSSIGSLWRNRPPGSSSSRAKILDNWVRGQASSLSPELRKTTYLNVDLNF